MNVADRYASASRETAFGHPMKALRHGLAAISHELRGVFGEVTDFEEILEGDMIMYSRLVDGKTKNALGIVDEKTDKYLRVGDDTFFDGMEVEYYIVGAGYPVLPQDSHQSESTFDYDDETPDVGTI